MTNRITEAMGKAMGLDIWQQPHQRPALPRSRPLPLASHRLVVQIVTASLFVNSAVLAVALAILARIG